MASANILSASVIFFFVSASFDCASASERSLSSTSRFETMPWPSSDLRFSKDSLAIFTFASSKGSTFSRLSLYCFVAVTRSSLTLAMLALESSPFLVFLFWGLASPASKRPATTAGMKLLRIIGQHPGPFGELVQKAIIHLHPGIFSICCPWISDSHQGRDYASLSKYEDLAGNVSEYFADLGGKGWCNYATVGDSAVKTRAF